MDADVLLNPVALIRVLALIVRSKATWVSRILKHKTSALSGAHSSA
jgi:hypothetical protein